MFRSAAGLVAADAAALRPQRVGDEAARGRRPGQGEVSAASVLRTLEVERDSARIVHETMAALVAARDDLAGLLREVIEKPELISSATMVRILLNRITELEAV